MPIPLIRSNSPNMGIENLKKEHSRPSSSESTSSQVSPIPIVNTNSNNNNNNNNNNKNQSYNINDNQNKIITENKSNINTHNLLDISYDDSTYDGKTFPTINKSDILNCTYSAWYSKYKKITPYSKIIRPLPKSFIEYLNSDGIALPEQNNRSRSLSSDSTDSTDFITRNRSPSDNNNNNNATLESSDLDSESESDPDYIDTISKDPTVEFPDLHKQIESTIDSLGGVVTPKLNWSSPKDATWIMPTNSLRCHDASDVYLILKASNFISYDLLHVFDQCDDNHIDINDQMNNDSNNDNNKNNNSITTNDMHIHNNSQLGDPTDVQYELVLRQWFNINPALEFRCFVRNRELLGISQRDPNYYPFLKSLEDTFIFEIEEFFENHLQFTFPLKNFTFDIYIPKPYSRVWLIDINPFASSTDSLLYSWEQLLSINPFSPSFELSIRFFPEDISAANFSSTKYSAHKVPQEVAQAGTTGESIAEFLSQWKDFTIKQS